MASDNVARALAIKANKTLPSISSADAGKLATVDSNGKWAAANLTVGQGEVAVDNTLLVSGAAADAKVTGDKLGELKSALNTEDASIKQMEEHENIPLTMNKKWGCSIGRKVIETDYGGAFYLSSAVTVTPGELYRITGKGYGTTAAFALGNSGTIVDVYPTSYASTSEYHFTDQMLIQIPNDVNELYVSNCTTGISITPKLEKVVSSTYLPFGEREINQVISTNTHFRMCPPVHYRGKKGKYVFKIDFVSVATNSSISFRVYNGTTSISTLDSINNINSGDKITYEIPETVIDDVATAIGFMFFANGSGLETLTVKIDYYVPESDNKINLDLMALHRKHGRMEFGAHMGAKTYAPAGSYAAYRVAGEMGFDWAWIAQVKHSADGTLWVCHDDTLNSITDYTGSKTIFEMTDTEILACKCNTTGLCYKLTDFTDAELHIPTLEEVIMLSVKYGMKMYFRCDDITDEYAPGNRTAAFVDMIKGYGIGINEAAYSIYDNTPRMNVLRTNLGNDIEISLFFSNSTTAQTYIDWFNTNNVTNRSVIMPFDVLTKADVQLLHKNNVKVYSYSNGSYELSRADVIQCAEWGVDAIQSGCWYYLPY